MQLPATHRHAGDDGLQPLSRASSVDSQPRLLTLASPVRLKRHVEGASEPDWRVASAGSCASLLSDGSAG